jgi:acetyltransferase
VPPLPAALVDAPAAGPAAVIRPACRLDVGAVREFLRGLSTESSYRRFFTGLGRIPDGFVRRLMDIDHDRREALVVVAGDGAVVALADYTVLTGRPDTAEFGVVVADGWQRHGLGPRLLEELMAIARSRGISRMRAHSLADNARVARLLRRRWPEAKPEREDTLLIWDLTL